MAAKLARSQRTMSMSGSAAPQAQSARSLLKVGDLLAGKYRVMRVLGEGGMGVVVEAYHELLDQRVAVKLLYQDAADQEAQSRLLLEARAAAKLQSEHVARVVDVDVGGNGLPFIVMELLEGADLCQVMDASGPLPRAVVVDYILQALEGLAHAHRRAIIHRDLKPSNLFLTNRPDGTQIIKILDFGISKSQNPSPDRRAVQLTGGRTVLGSPPYMSPEQVRSPKSVDHRTDIWALGICMYELLTDSMPFGGDELQETFAQILERTPTPIHAFVADFPAELEGVVMKCLAKRREDRFSDVGELASALVPFGSGAWNPSAERIRGTLSRSVLEETGSGVRLQGDGSSDRLLIPSSRRRLDSQQPELHGTASTVAGRFTIFERRRRWVVVASAVAAISGFALMGVGYMKRNAAQTSAAEAEVRADPRKVDPPPVAVDPAIPASVSLVPSVPTGSGTESAAQGTVIVRPTVAQAAVARPPSPPASHSAKTNKVESAQVPHPSPPAPVSRPASRPPPSPSPAIPDGLPMTRSGQ